MITGANHGMGAATAKAFAAQEAKVFLSYYRDECRYSDEELDKAREAGIGGDVLYWALQQQSADPLIDHIRATGGVATAREADLADPDNIPRLFDWCQEELGPVDVLINNHTYCVQETFDPDQTTNEGGGIHLASAARIDAHFAVNARACALMMTEYLKRYRERRATWGRIIQRSS